MNICALRRQHVCVTQASAHRWYVCGLREARKVCRSRKATAVILAPNIEEVAVVGGLDDHVQAIIDL